MIVAKNRVKISACYNSFVNELRRLKRFDDSNQRKFASRKLTSTQIELLAESIFFTGYRTFENFVREIFLLYCMEKKPRDLSMVSSYLSPKDFMHTESLIKSSMPFLDWNSPDNVIRRAELYLENGHPIKTPFASNIDILNEFKKIRNHIAHNSIESENGFKRVLNRHFGYTPLQHYSPGQYLLLTSTRNGANYNLLDFFDLMSSISYELT